MTDTTDTTTLNADMLAAITAVRAVGQPADGHSAATGEPYQHFGGEHVETSKEACDAFLASFTAYQKEHPGGRLYIGQAPTLKFSSVLRQWTVYARLLISKKRVKK